MCLVPINVTAFSTYCLSTALSTYTLGSDRIILDQGRVRLNSDKFLGFGGGGESAQIKVFNQIQRRPVLCISFSPLKQSVAMRLHTAQKRA